MQCRAWGTFVQGKGTARQEMGQSRKRYKKYITKNITAPRELAQACSLDGRNFYTGNSMNQHSHSQQIFEFAHFTSSALSASATCASPMLSLRSGRCDQPVDSRSTRVLECQKSTTRYFHYTYRACFIPVVPAVVYALATYT